MGYLVIKALISGAIIAIVSEVAKRSPSFGALIVSLPLLSIMGIIWLWHDTKDSERIAAHALATFWYVLPSLPFFVLFPIMLRNGFSFWASLGTGAAVTITLYFAMVVVLQRFGIAI